MCDPADLAITRESRWMQIGFCLALTDIIIGCQFPDKSYKDEKKRYERALSLLVKLLEQALAYGQYGRAMAMEVPGWEDKLPQCVNDSIAASEILRELIAHHPVEDEYEIECTRMLDLARRAECIHELGLDERNALRDFVKRMCEHIERAITPPFSCYD